MKSFQATSSAQLALNNAAECLPADMFDTPLFVLCLTLFITASSCLWFTFDPDRVIDRFKRQRSSKQYPRNRPPDGKRQITKIVHIYLVIQEPSISKERFGFPHASEMISAIAT